ncbi:prepilin peptidase [Celeribacter litoreus]|uniref:prepilin peptidase n=1 Tax=Celeribacter litoreus TaxID=2876714 RepID=UPI001CCBD3D8|nr:prepilin peptidase [Celeribacter litoreus]MCA0043916.1 prepilin peptidase [Celeribacter litoreus]
MSAVEFLQYLSAFSIIGLLTYICIHDFRHLIIENWTVVTLFGLYVIWAGLAGFPSVWTDVFMAALFFLLAFVMWIFRAMGAGDVKLYFVLGLLMGMEWAVVFIALLLVCSVLFWVGLRLSARYENKSNYVISRFRFFREEGVLPYGVVLTLSAVPAIIGRFFG